jgi:hypothetical protein
MPPLEQAYIGDYMRARAGTTFHLNNSYQLVFLGGGKAKPRLAFPFDFTAGNMTLPSGKTAPFALAELARAEGYKFPFRAPARKYTDASMYRWLHALRRASYRRRCHSYCTACMGRSPGHQAFPSDEIWPRSAWPRDAHATAVQPGCQG